MPAETLPHGSGGSSISESLLAGSTLKPILNILFGIGAIITFAELLIVLRRAFT